MLLDKFKKILPRNDNGYPSEFQEIISNLNSTSDFDDEKILFIWNAFCYSQKAHKGQKRHSGKPYFTHCSSVGVILSKWKMDSRTIAAGLLHDVIEDTEITRQDIIDNFGCFYLLQKIFASLLLSLLIVCII